MLTDSTIAFIGSGSMAEAMISGLLGRQMADPARLCASGPREARAQQLRARYGIVALADNAAAVAGADIVVIAVKPQVLEAVLAELAGRIQPGALVLSIVAGAPIARIAAGLGHEVIVRSMPNTPAQIGQGITVWIAAPGVSERQREAARTLLRALGEEVEADYEDQLDMATALSGSGPGYVFLFMEALIDAGVHLGFSRRVSEQLVIQTVLGSVGYYQHSESHVARLRNQVTSPGGTTAEAMYYLEKAGFRTAISRAVWAAYQRSVELGQGRKRFDRLQRD
jgi:pyrroline-5-carboxylate reductase